MDDLGALLLALAIIPFILFFARVILLSWRYYTLTQELKQLQQLEQARRQAEINATNSSGNGSGGNCNTNCVPNDISILPKDYDLPPAYDEVVINAKQQLQAANNNPPPSFVSTTSMTITGAVSTITIETDLESSNTNLATTSSSVDNVPAAAAMELSCVSSSTGTTPATSDTPKSIDVAEHTL